MLQNYVGQLLRAKSKRVHFVDGCFYPHSCHFSSFHLFGKQKKQKITPIILFIEMKECLCFKLIQATLLEVIGKASTRPKTHISAPKLSRSCLC